MNYKYTILYVSFSFFGCKGMHLDFTHMHHEAGLAKGEKEAKAQLLLSQESSAMLRPLITQFNVTMDLLKDHPEAKGEFKGYALGFALMLYRYNHEHSEAPIKLSNTAIQDFVNSPAQKANDVPQKNREELVKLLTAELINKKLLILD